MHRHVRFELLNVLFIPVFHRPRNCMATISGFAVKLAVRERRDAGDKADRHYYLPREIA